MYYKLIKRTPVQYGTDLSEEIAVANRTETLIEHLRYTLGMSLLNAPIIDASYSFEKEFGYASKRPSTEPYYEIVEVKNGMIIITTQDI